MLCPDLLGELKCSSRPSSHNKGPTSKGSGRQGTGVSVGRGKEGEEGNGKGEEKERRGWEGRGGENRPLMNVGWLRACYESLFCRLGNSIHDSYICRVYCFMI